MPPQNMQTCAAEFPVALDADHGGHNFRVVLARLRFVAASGNGRVFHLHAHLAQAQHLAARQWSFQHLFVVHKHAVGGIHVTHEHAVLAQLDLGVEARNGIVLDLEIVP